jgi:PAS domain S-box-containing protein
MDVPRNLEPSNADPKTIQNGPAVPPSPADVAALEQREREQRDFLENAAVAMHWVGEDGTILWANRAELELLGYAAEDYIGRNIVSFHMDEPVILDILNRLKCNEALRGYEARLRCKDGSIRYVSINSITRTDLPSVRMHDFQLEQLFQNLVGNAIRYKSGVSPQIHIAAERRESAWLFSVQDNGIGIEPQYKEQIFELFKRLHSVAEYPGTGMGLAICQRIVERAGGRLWVESEPGRGSTFFFTIPCREA